MLAPLILSLRLARRELRGGLKGFRLFLLCLALGVGAIAAVGMLTEALVRGLHADGGKLLGGDVELRLSHRQWKPHHRDYVASQAKISYVTELQTMARGNAKSRALVELKGVDDFYPHYGRLTLKAGGELSEALTHRDGVWGAVVEPPVLRRLKLALGDRIELGAIQVEVRGVIDREPDRGADGFMLGPRIMVALPVVAKTGLITDGSLVRYRYRLKLDEGVGLLDFKRALRKQFPRAGWRVRDVRNGAPGLKRFVDRMRFFLTLVGLTSLLVGGLGIANAVKAYLDTKTGTIATLKCLGAPAHLVFMTYLWQVLALAGLGTAVGLLLGTLSPLVLSELIANVLPFKAAIGIYWPPLVLASVYGILTALCFALWPLAVAREIPAGALFRNLVVPTHMRPRLKYLLAILAAASALATITIATAEITRFAVMFVFGVTAALGLFLIVGMGLKDLLRRLPRSRRPSLRLALANLSRPGAATVSVTLSFGLGLSVLVTMMVLRANIEYQVAERLPDEAPAYFFLDILPSQAPDFDKTALSVAGVRDINKVPWLRGRITKVNGIAADKIKPDPGTGWVLRGDRGITYTPVAPKNSTIVEGKWWPADYNGSPLLSLDVRAARGLKIGIGDSMTVNVMGREITARIANLRRIDWGTFGLNFVLVFSPGLLSSAPHTFVATAKADEASELALEVAITDRFRNITAIRVRDALDAINRILGNISIAVRATASVTLLAGILVLAGALAAGHRRRVYDSVVLKVLGARRADIMKAYLLEYALLGLITAGLASLVGVIFAHHIVTRVYNATWYFPPATVAWTIALSLVVSVAAGLIATWAALSQKPAPLLRNE